MKNRLKHTQLKQHREAKVIEQNNMCPLCLQVIDDPVLDHCHSTGYCRAALCRVCNVIEGKIFNWFNTFGKYKDAETVMNRLLDYWITDWTTQPTHPKHKTTNEKEILRLKRRLKKVKKKTTKDKILKQIEELSND